MSLRQPLEEYSWVHGNDPLVLTEIFSEKHSVAVWERPANQQIENYLRTHYKRLGINVREVFHIDSLKQDLLDIFPDTAGQEQLVEDIYLLSDMLTCMFDCQHVGLRLTPMEKAMCPKFHVDQIPVRLVCTYLGQGTQWIPRENGAVAGEEDLSAIHIQQVTAYDVALLKGSAWPEQEHMGTLHRSCPMEAGEKRVLLTLDPM